MNNPQTEARAIARKILEDYGLDADEHFVLAESIATALAAKDAELAELETVKRERDALRRCVDDMCQASAETKLAAKDANIKILGEQMVTERLHGYELLERAERAEAQLAEANKALVIANAQLDNMEFLSVEGFIDCQQEHRAARRAREAALRGDAS